MQRPWQLPRRGSWRGTPRRRQLEKEQSLINRRMARALMWRWAKRRKSVSRKWDNIPYSRAKVPVNEKNTFTRSPYEFLAMARPSIDRFGLRYDQPFLRRTR